MKNEFGSVYIKKLSASDSIKCQNLSFRYANQNIFTNLSFNLNAQSSLSVTGTNGSGKTTLLKILAGILKPTTGHVFCFNEEIWPKKKITFEHKSIYLAYKPAFYVDQSVRSN